MTTNKNVWWPENNVLIIVTPEETLYSIKFHDGTRNDVTFACTAPFCSLYRAASVCDVSSVR